MWGGWVGVWLGCWGGGGRLAQTVKAKAVECLGKTPFGKAKSLIALVQFLGGLIM